MIRFPFAGLVLLAALLAAPAPRAGAAPELQVQLNVARRNFISLEPVMATVTITNTVGRDVVVGGPAGRSWLEFEIKRNGRPVGMIQPLGVEPIMLRSGETLQRDFNLARHFYLSDPGTYVVRASAYFPAPLNRYSSSKHIRFFVQSERKPKWEQPFVMPAGYSDSGKYRRWQLFTFHDENDTRLYASLFDEHSRSVIRRFPLGTILLNREFQPMLDGEGNLHVLYAGNSSAYVCQIVSPDGRILDRQFFRNVRPAPRLVAMGTGQVAVSGGAVFDPSAPEPSPGSALRRLSDRPANLPAAREE